MALGPWLSVEEAAAIMGVSPGRVRHIIVAGGIPSRLEGRKRWIHRRAAATWEPRPQGAAGHRERMTRMARTVGEATYDHLPEGQGAPDIPEGTTLRGVLAAWRAMDWGTIGEGEVMLDDGTALVVALRSDGSGRIMGSQRVARYGCTPQGCPDQGDRRATYNLTGDH